eukprot:Gregarina_sp_Poly_1__8622@NODE_511_length_7822_cov_202_696067_g407_i0_p2_GENE_NODE_511_length_7822_cov_202_696067_g407_i0NODE_511_length_7822_cov_202_696067_g407_i0_p2_ORF_typecomplete_len743_score94_93ANAPC4_WD40/PF12894_7/0_017ANAPC4_WD40/PF12894_7/61ANAPC4_WD40/PF12894_7/7e02ANAPC4_WD40/PF12894_7/4_9Ge1_WD40/PF16529_5/0_037Ge1_WD40/PF16529_5/0_15WD40/PF00400_32/1_2e03WD40/PF00400_32/0_0013WD40/PF00400_32/8e03WD40/PF00400_32/0_13WD40/PF00400_32/4_1e03DPPIV_N/PF00930_21/0_024WD40_like/PF17005_5
MERGGVLSGAQFGLDGRTLYWCEGRAVWCGPIWQSDKTDAERRLVWNSGDRDLRIESLHLFYLSWEDIQRFVVEREDETLKLLKESISRNSKLIKKVLCSAIAIVTNTSEIHICLEFGLSPKDAKKFEMSDFGIGIGSVKIESLLFLESDCEGTLVAALWDSKAATSSVHKTGILDLLNWLPANGDSRVVEKGFASASLVCTLTKEEVPVFSDYQNGCLAVVQQPLETAGEAQAEMALVIVDLTKKTASRVSIPEQRSLGLTSVAVNPSGESCCVCDQRGRLIWVNNRPGSSSGDHELTSPKKKRKREETVDYTMRHWHDHPVSCLGFSPNGDITISGDEKGTLSFWSELQTGRDRSSFRHLGAPVIGRLCAPCPQMVVRHSTQLDPIRACVVVVLANNVIRVIDTARHEIIQTIRGLPAPCVSPELHVMRRVQSRMAAIRASENSPPVNLLLKNMMPSLAVMPLNASDFLVTQVFAAVEAEITDDGSLSLWKFNDDGLSSVGEFKFRETLEWSRQPPNNWASFWHTRSFAIRDDLSSFLVSESHRIDLTAERHRLKFFVASKSFSYSLITSIFVSSPVCCVLSVAHKVPTFVTGSEDGEVCVWQYTKQENIQSYVLTCRLCLTRRSAIHKLAHVGSLLFVLAFGKISVLKMNLHPDSVATTQMKLLRSISLTFVGNPRSLRHKKRSHAGPECSDFALGIVWCVSVCGSLIQADSVAEDASVLDSKRIQLEPGTGDTVVGSS